MCECKNKEQADAWVRVWDALKQGNPEFHFGNRSGQELAAAEVRRLQALAARTTLAEATLATVRRERDEQNFRANAAEASIARAVDDRNAAQRERDMESRNKNAALDLLEKERIISDHLAKELVKSRDELARAQSPLPPTMGGGSDTHRQNVRQAVHRLARNDGMTVTNHPRRVAEAVYYLLDRDRLQTVAIKRLSERLDALEPNKKQAADQCAQGFAPAAPKQSFDSPPPGQW